MNIQYVRKVRHWRMEMGKSLVVVAFRLETNGERERVQKSGESLDSRERKR